MKKLISFFSLLTLISACSMSETSSVHKDWKRVVGESNCNCSIEIPPGWSDDIGVYDNAALEVAGEAVQVAVFLSPKTDSSEFNLDQHAETVLKNLEKSSKVYKEQTRRRLKISDKNALQFRIERTDQNDDSSVNLLTFVEGNTTYYEILGWSFPESYSRVKDLISDVTRSFKVGSL